jgi:alpha-D-ribose 1-methylphosphonate 5-triphosphate synthase subunit PhnH
MSAGPDLGRMTPGFADPTRGAQAAFREILEAMARPGRIADLSGAPMPPAGLGRAAAGFLLSLADRDTPLWTDPALPAAALDWLRFHTGARVTSMPVEAAFALIAAISAMPPLDAFDAGDAKYPDRSATLVFDLPSLTGGPALVLTGPGIRESIAIAPQGLTAGFWKERASLAPLYPAGIDLVLAAGDGLVCIPRTTRVRTEGG